MHCQIIDRYFNIFFVEIQLTKQNLKSDNWASEFGRPNRYTGLPNGLYTSLNIEEGGLAYKGELGQFADLRGGLARKRVWCFLEGGG